MWVLNRFGGMAWGLRPTNRENLPTDAGQDGIPRPIGNRPAAYAGRTTLWSGRPCAKRRLSSDSSSQFFVLSNRSPGCRSFNRTRLRARRAALKGGCTVETPRNSLKIHSARKRPDSERASPVPAAGRLPIGRRMPSCPTTIAWFSSLLVGRRPIRTARIGCPTKKQRRFPQIG
jgi:hypothetical protein